MDLTQAIATIEKSNPEVAQALTEHQTEFNNTMSRISTLELDAQTNQEKRDKLKNLIKQTTGLEEINEESLRSVLAGKGGEDVEVYKKDIKALQDNLAAGANAVDEVTDKYEKQIFGLRLDKAASLLGVAEEVHNAHAHKIILEELAKGAVLDQETGEFKYKNPDGTTQFNGAKEMTLNAKYEQLKANEDFDYLFRPQFKAGGGKSPSKGPTTDAGGATLRRSKMSDTDKVTYISKNGMDAYKNLSF